ncbi:MAG: hypothetical protein HC846_10105 [Blastocatellia bacterium]|nr:hypothetical protein [Blastocatellia bacterium]
MRIFDRHHARLALTKQRDVVLKANKGILVKDEEFTNGNITGREVRIRMPDTRTFTRETSLKPQNRIQRFRMFFKVIVFIWYLPFYLKKIFNSPEIDKYFNSFTLK